MLLVLKFMVLNMRNKNAKVSNPDDFITCSGDQFQVEYSPIVNPDGTIDLIESGKIDINEMINSFKDSTDMAYILKQLALGNTDVLAQRQGVFADFTEFPKTYAEVLQLRIDAEKSFYELPVETRQKFNNDFNVYFATAGQTEWFEKLGVTEKVEEVKEEVNVDES